MRGNCPSGHGFAIVLGYLLVLKKTWGFAMRCPQLDEARQQERQGLAAPCLCHAWRCPKLGAQGAKLHDDLDNRWVCYNMLH